MEAETDAGFIQREVAKISIHSARVGGDSVYRRKRARNFNFNPLRPCGRRLVTITIYLVQVVISIHSARVGGDKTGHRSRYMVPISIHSARVGGDLIRPGAVLHTDISIHSARVGGDASAENVGTESPPISIHSARVGGDNFRFI